MFRFKTLLCFGLTLSVSAVAEEVPALTPEQNTFFENRIRPILSEHCYQCHAEDSEKLKGSLLLDSKAGWMRGGDTGEVIIPGDADSSLLMKMVHHEPGYDAMPPKSKLKDNEIADLARWINEGAFDPRDQEIGELKNVDIFDLEERKQWWSFQPIKSHPLPQVKNADWTKHEYDHFVLAKLEEKGWQPAAPASKRSLLRRLSFDLIGLAPTAEEMDAFLADTSPDAYTKQVDRLLASPHFGEKWARHWMDAVRYAETKSFEFDYTMPHAYRYRNYLIRMFNEDIGYDNFVRESFAGDLLEQPRYSQDGLVNESIKGSGFLYLTDGQHGPPDLHEDEARIFSGMIDAASKSYLGMTIACARCHDHKFDAITAGDYYSWYGMLRSSRLEIANTVTESKQVEMIPGLKQQKAKLYQAALEDAGKDIGQISAYVESLQGIAKHPEFSKQQKKWNEAIGGKNKAKADTFLTEQQVQQAPKKDAPLAASLEGFVLEEAQKRDLDSKVLNAWTRVFALPTFQKRWPQLAPLYQKMKQGKDLVPTKGLAQLPPIQPYYPTDLSQWVSTGPAFNYLDQGKAAQPEPILAVANEQHVVQTLVDLQNPTTGLYSGRITGSLRSPDFILDGNPVEIYAKGRNGRVNLIVRNYEQVGFGPTTRILSAPINQGGWQRISIQTKLWKGEPAYLEIIHDGEARRLRANRNQKADDGYISISTRNELSNWNELWQQKSVAETIQQIWQEARAGNLTPAGTEILAALFESGLIRAGADRSEQLKSLLEQYRAIHNKIPEPQYARSLVDGTPQDVPIYIRGSHQSLSQDPNPRRFMDALGGEELAPGASGRREFVEHMVDESNPLTSRVMVNRIWHHIFGRGIVSSIDDLGKLGTLPSHPELLDYLALDFMANEWSVKYMIRKMVTTATYQMSTLPAEEALTMDPDNSLLQRMPVKRLEAEQIRDHILLVSGRLNREFYGPSIKSYAADLPRARGFPGSGPVDGEGRRSVYMELRRNFMPSFLRILGMPNGVEPIGARNITNVPAQSLALMNSEFTRQQAQVWAEQLLKTEADDTARIQRMHEVALGRPANEADLAWAQELLSEVTKLYQGQGEVKEVAVWQEVCHVMMNRKEFIYLL